MEVSFTFSSQSAQSQYSFAEWYERERERVFFPFLLKCSSFEAALSTDIFFLGAFLKKIAEGL